MHQLQRVPAAMPEQCDLRGRSVMGTLRRDSDTWPSHLCAVDLVSPAQDSDTARSVEFFLSFPRACLARARNPEFRWRTSGRTGILRAAATRENDRARDRARPELSR